MSVCLSVRRSVGLFIMLTETALQNEIKVVVCLGLVSINLSVFLYVCHGVCLFVCQYFGLTGTALQNKMTYLWCVLDG